jgi:hypothetical protein
MQKEHYKSKKVDLQGIEPWTTPSRASLEEELMLREYYTTKPQARSSSYLLI